MILIYDVYKVGKAIRDIMENDEMDSMLNPETPANITHVLAIDLIQEGDVVKYKGISSSEYNQDDAKKFLLRKASSNGPNYGPSAQLTVDEKTLTKKIAAWFRDAKDETQNTEMKKIFSEIYEVIIKNKKEILREINEQKPKGKKVQILLTVSLNNQFPLYVEMFFKYYSQKIKRKIIGEENHKGTCCLCGENDVSLVPKVDIFKFYTLDKPGFISGGFSERDIWRNCPICISCEPILREGKKFMLEYLKFRFSGFDYYVIPSTTCNDDTQESLIGIMIDKISQKSFKLQEESNKDFESLCNDMFEELSNERDIKSFRIIFFKKDNSAERILLDMKDIFPSRFAVLYSAKYMMEEIFEELTKEKFSFRYFRQFLSKTDPSSKVNDLDANFLALMQAIFIKKRISLEILLPHYMRNIRRAFLNEEYFFHNVLRSWIGIKYLQEIGCIKYKEDEGYVNEKIEKLLEPYDIGLNTNLKKALMLIGVLAQKVMNIQAKNLNGSTPFTKKLKDFRLRRADVQGLFAEEIKIMQQYESFSKSSKLIAEAVTELIIKSDAEWTLSVDEINFYIAGGLVLSNKIYEGLKEE